MKSLTMILLTSFLTMGGNLKAALPEFSKYQVPYGEIFTGTPAPIDLTSFKGANTYRTKLTEGAKQGPNFAGHYTVVSFGCGTQCQDNWVIDATTGKIHARFPSIIGQNYRLNSFLMIVNPPEQQLKKAYEQFPDQPLLGTMDTTAQVWKDNQFEVIQTVKWVDAIKELHD